MKKENNWLKEVFKDSDNIEKIIGGLFGVIAIVAIILEMFLGGFSKDAIAGGVKDISSTAIVIVMLWVAIKALMPKKEEPFDFNNEFQKRLSEWQNKNSNMIVRNDKIDGGSYGFGMKTSVEDFYNKTSITKDAGWFARLPLIDENTYMQGGFEIQFHLNKGTFFSNRPELQGKELNDEFDKLSKLFVSFVNQKFGDSISAGGKNDNIVVKVNRKIETIEDIDFIVEIINTMYQAYLVAANISKKI